MALAGEEFIRRFLLHVLPKGFMRIRHYGLLANRHRAEQLARAREALDVPTPEPAPPESLEAYVLRVTGHPIDQCPFCRIGRLYTIATLEPRRLPPAIGPPVNPPPPR